MPNSPCSLKCSHTPVLSYVQQDLRHPMPLRTFGRKASQNQWNLVNQSVPPEGAGRAALILLLTLGLLWTGMGSATASVGVAFFGPPAVAPNPSVHGGTSLEIERRQERTKTCVVGFSKQRINETPAKPVKQGVVVESLWGLYRISPTKRNCRLVWPNGAKFSPILNFGTGLVYGEMLFQHIYIDARSYVSLFGREPEWLYISSQIESWPLSNILDADHGIQGHAIWRNLPPYQYGDSAKNDHPAVLQKARFSGLDNLPYEQDGSPSSDNSGRPSAFSGPLFAQRTPSASFIWRCSFSAWRRV